MSDSPPAAAGKQEGTALFSTNYRRYVLGVLVFVYVFNFIDRQILAILMQPIKEDLGLNDTQLGFLSGIAFAVFYATLGIPIARLADTRSRVNIVSISLAVWSIMTAVTGFAQNFWQMAAARIGVGIGEAGCSPPSHSLISDYFPPESRATALSIYALGIPIGILFGFLAGGWIEQFFGWRLAFFVVGIPGVFLAIVVKLSLREPPRGHSETGSGSKAFASDAPPPEIKRVVAYLWERKSFRHLALAAAIHGFVGYGMTSWLPAFLNRSYGMSSGEIGTWLAMLVGVAGGLGTISGGYISDKFGSKDARWYMWVPAITLGLSVPFFISAFLVSDQLQTMLLLIIPLYFGTFYLGPTFAMVQGLVEVRMRALAAAVLLFVLNLIGLGLGPQIVGIVSDLLTPMFGIEGLRYALMAVFLGNLWSAFHYYIASRHLRADLAANPERAQDAPSATEAEALAERGT